MSIEFKIGADPEFFLLDTETGKHVSAFGMIPGTKHDPFPVEGGAVQVDGMALEFNIDPVTSLVDFHKNIGRVLKQLREMVPERYKFDFTPVAHFGKEYIEEQPDEAKALGCDPDFNAWMNGAINPKPDGSMGMRTASGHIHIGWTQDQDVTDPEHIQACIMLVKQLDFYLGVPSLVWDKESLRRSMYGAPGAFRPKRYGVEYRTMSNAWVNDEQLRSVVYNQAVQGATKLLGGKRVYEAFGNDHYINMLFNWGKWNEIQEVIFAYTNFKNERDLRFMDGLVGKVRASGEREEFQTQTKLFEQGHFLRKSDFTMIPYEEVTHEEYHEDGVTNPFDVYRFSKSGDLPKPEFKTNAEYLQELKKANPKAAKGMKPGQINIAPGIVIHDPFANPFGNGVMNKWQQAALEAAAKPANWKKPAIKMPAPQPMFILDDPDPELEF